MKNAFARFCAFALLAAFTVSDADAQSNANTFRNATISWYYDEMNFASDTVLHRLIDHFKSVGYSGITFQTTVDVDATGKVLNTHSQTRMLQMVDYARTQGLTAAHQTNWSISSNIALDANDTPAGFDIPTFLSGARQYFKALASVAQAHGISTIYLGYHCDNFVASQYRSQWVDIIGDVRAAFAGELSYIGWYFDSLPKNVLGLAFENIGIWDLLDTIAIELHTPYPVMPLYDSNDIQAGYFYRTNSQNNVVADLIRLHRTYNKPIVIGALYFMNLDNALDGTDPTPTQALANPLPLNSAAQTAAYQAALEVINKNLNGIVIGINFSLYEPWTYQTFVASAGLSASDAALLNSFKYVAALAGPTDTFPGTPAEQLVSQYVKQPSSYHTTSMTNGGPGNDIIYVNSGNNTIVPNGGQDEIHGGTGIDTVMFGGNRSTYTIATTATGLTVTDNANAGNVVAMTGVARLQFADAALMTLNFAPGWNLVGNSVNGALGAASAFANAANVTTVWKWNAATANWAFYTPTLADGGEAYAAGKGYEFLTTINAGEGFWVNAKLAFTVQLPAGTAITASSFQDQPSPPNKLPSGWSLIAIGENNTPSDFNVAVSAIPPSQGVIPVNLTSLWAWDGGLSKWYFYAPSLERTGGLSGYAASKGYLDFAPVGKTLGPGVGFWVNKP